MKLEVQNWGEHDADGYDQIENWENSQAAPGIEVLEEVFTALCVIQNAGNQKP